MRLLRALLPLFFALVAGCTLDPTQVMVVVDGEFATPTEVDELLLAITSPDGNRVSSTADMTVPGGGFPRVVGVLQGDGPEGAYTVEVLARKGGVNVVRRIARFHFTRGEVTMLRIDLLRDCVDRICIDDSRTCGEGGLCERIDVPTDPWRGEPATQFDAGVVVQPIVIGP